MLEVLAIVIRQEKDIKIVHIRKKKIKTLFIIEDIIIYIKYREFTKTY